MKNKTFKCAQCEQTFKKTRPEKEVLAEKKENGWGHIQMEDMARVCDSCYEQIVENRQRHLPR